MLGLGGWLGGLVLAFLGAPLLAPLLIDWIAPPTMRWLAAFVIIFIAVRLVAWGLGKLLAELVQVSSLGVFDKVVGLLFGLFRASALAIIITFLCMSTRITSTPLWQNALSSAHLTQIVSNLLPFLPADIQAWTHKR